MPAGLGVANLLSMGGRVPNRYVRESAIESETVDRLSWSAEVFWRRLINRVDDFGRFTGNLELLRASIFPLKLNKVSATDIGKMLLECESSGLISRWKGEDGKDYLAMHKWEKGRAKFSRYPDPPPDVANRLQTSVNNGERLFANVPDSDYDSDHDNDNIPPTPQKGRKPREVFVSPTYEEVYAYCQSRKNRINPITFLAHYEANGWMVGRHKMRDWKAAIVTWEGRERDKPLNLRNR